MKLVSLFVLLHCVLTCHGLEHRLPDGPVIAGYTNQASVQTILHSVDQGVNVLIWSFIELRGNISADPAQGAPNPSVAAGVAEGLRTRNKTVTHLVSYGGWDAPHPDTSRTGTEWWALWREWDVEFSRQVGSKAWSGFDGVDLDAEGNDDAHSPDNRFSPALIRVCGDFAQAAKKDGYLSTMVPPQSYLDSGSSAFDPNGLVTHTDSWRPDFPYHGQNTYAPLLALYPDSYDLVIVQIYEGYSRAGEAVLGDKKVPPTTYLASMVEQYVRGWEVKFGGAFGLPATQLLKVPPSKLVVGLANGWATPPKASPKLARKALYVDGDAAGLAFKRVGGLKKLRGFAYWDIRDDNDHIGLARKLTKHMM